MKNIITWAWEHFGKLLLVNPVCWGIYKCKIKTSIQRESHISTKSVSQPKLIWDGLKQRGKCAVIWWVHISDWFWKSSASVLVWGWCVCAYDMPHLWRHHQCWKILKQDMLPFRRHFQRRPCLFQQADAKPHSSRVTTACPPSESVWVLDGPRCSPDPCAVHYKVQVMTTQPPDCCTTEVGHQESLGKNFTLPDSMLSS